MHSAIVRATSVISSGHFKSWASVLEGLRYTASDKDVRWNAKMISRFKNCNFHISDIYRIVLYFLIAWSD